MRILNRRLIVGSFCVLLLTNGLWAEDKQAISDSVKRAIDYLKKNALSDRYRPPGATGGAGQGFASSGYQEGPAVLAGIALLEAGVPASDPVIQEIAKGARECAISQGSTYQLALDIIFLDKLGEQIDTVLIQSMGVRMLAGQHRMTGGWTYGVLFPDGAEQERLRSALKGATLKGTTTLPDGKSDIKSRPPLDPALEEIMRTGRLRANPAMNSESQDNSNTQFAFIALWSARKHGVPVDRALKLVEERYRKSQVVRGNQGGWSYVITNYPMPTPSMTCVGLLGLAVVSGLRGEARMKGGIIVNGKFKPSQGSKNKGGVNPLDDNQVKLGLNFLAASLAGRQWAPEQNRGGPAGPGRRPGIIGGGPPAGMGRSGDLRDDLYFMWCIERVGMVFGISKIGDVDWHEWGSSYLLKSQQTDGSWMGKAGHPSGTPLVDTAFGLMFMCRSNIVRDLSKVLKATAELDKMKPSTPRVGANEKGTRPSKPSSSKELVKALVEASADRKLELISEYSDENAKGGSYTVALAEAIPQLPSEAQKKAIEGLAYRLARMTPKTLSAYLDYDNAEIRRAACYAVYMSDHRKLVPKLIKAIEDSEEIVWRAAGLSLREMSKRDYGPRAGDSPAKRKEAAALWEAWWKTQSK